MRRLLLAIEWSPGLSTGVPWQDKQHKELFKRMDSLIEAMNMGRGKEEVSRLLKFLDDYFVVHFEAEEQAMNKYGYPGTVSHLAAHTRFIDDMAVLKGEFAKGPTTTLVIKVQRQVVDWLINHIGGIDKELGAFILKADAANKGRQ